MTGMLFGQLILSSQLGPFIGRPPRPCFNQQGLSNRHLAQPYMHSTFFITAFIKRPFCLA